MGMGDFVMKTWAVMLYIAVISSAALILQIIQALGD